MAPDGSRRSGVCGKWLKVSQNTYVGEWRVCSSLEFIFHPFFKNAYRSIFATVLPGLDPIGFVESDVKSRKTRALRGGRVCILPVCLLVLMIFSILCWGGGSPCMHFYM